MAGKPAVELLEGKANTEMNNGIIKDSTCNTKVKLFSL